MEFVLAGVLLSYLLGSIPSAVWVGRIWYGLDIREHGSGNAGATNTFRVLGKKAGTLVLFADVLKGFLAASLVVPLVSMGHVEAQDAVLWKLMFGVAAIIGHLLPVFAQFRGGKGVATLGGAMLAVHWSLTLSCMLIFLMLLLLTKYVSLSSLVATLSFPILAFLVPAFGVEGSVLIYFGLGLFVALAVTHRKNIVRLIKGVENKTYLFKKQKHASESLH